MLTLHLFVLSFHFFIHYHRYQNYLVLSSSVAIDTQMKHYHYLHLQVVRHAVAKASETVTRVETSAIAAVASNVSYLSDSSSCAVVGRASEMILM